MATLKIYDLNDSQEKLPISIFSEGEHTIGRDKLNCKDKRISRNHALITVSGDSVTLKATHINPSFYKPKGGNCVQLLRKDNSITLGDGDQFALLPDEFWFRVKLAQEDPPGRDDSDDVIEHHNTNEVQNISDKVVENHNYENVKENQKAVSDSEGSLDFTEAFLKEKEETEIKERELKSNYDTEYLKETVSDSEGSLDFTDAFVKQKEEIEVKDKELDSKNDTDKNLILVEASTEQINKLSDSATEDKDYISDTDKETEAKDEENKPKENLDRGESSKQNNEEKNATDSVTAKTDDINQQNPSSSDTKTRRDRCWFGDKCYRKNPVHRVDFSHPGDSDYNSDPDDDRPDCPFGNACYRKNPDHRKQYKHSKPPATNPVHTNTNPISTNANLLNLNQNGGNDDESDDEADNNTPPQGRKRKAAAKVKKYTESPVDDYDIEDPFINDASSDDFQISGDEDSDDSDFIDSQEVDEESQEKRRLLKEAKRFTRKKQKK